MTPEQKIITIAEFEGIKPSREWKVPLHADWSIIRLSSKAEAEKERQKHQEWCVSIGEKDESKAPEEYDEWSDAPPYLTSRDAIYGAVARLDDMEFCYFVEHLERVCKTDGWEIMGPIERRRMILATPSQLADALLLTLGHEL